MASEGPNNPGTMADDSAIGDLTWSNVDNAKTSDNSYSNASTVGIEPGNQFSHYLKATNFGFSIPSGATIDGIEVKIEAKKTQSTGGGQDDVVKIVKSDGSIGTADKSTDTEYTTSDVIRTYGGSSDLWSETWSDTDINDIDFGVVLAIIVSRGKGAQTVAVDHITITVTYTEAAGGTNMQINIGDAWKAVPAIKINIGDVWKNVVAVKQNIGDVWKDVF